MIIEFVKAIAFIVPIMLALNSMLVDFNRQKVLLKRLECSLYKQFVNLKCKQGLIEFNDGVIKSSLGNIYFKKSKTKKLFRGVYEKTLGTLEQKIKSRQKSSKAK